MNSEQHCPYSKVIFGRYLHCPHAQLGDQRTRHVNCLSTDTLRPKCISVDNMLTAMIQTLPGLEHEESNVSFAQLLKVRAGGLLGMQRILNIDKDDITEIILAAEQRYGEAARFPFAELYEDIDTFKARKKRNK